MPMVGETGQVELTASAARMAGDLLTWLSGSGSRLLQIVARRQCEQMLLAFRVDMPLTPPAVNPALVPGEFFQSGRMLLLEPGVGVGRLVQPAVQFGNFVLGRGGFAL